MIVVTGTAPRCGTSAMMRLLQTEFPVHSWFEAFPEYVAKEKNPEGFWDIKADQVKSKEPIPYEENSVLKVWAPHFPRLPLDRVKLLILMEREDFENQVKSIYDCAIAEGFGELTPDNILGLFHAQQNGIKSHFSNTPVIRIKMEDLRQYPDQVISHIKEII